MVNGALIKPSSVVRAIEVMEIPKAHKWQKVCRTWVIWNAVGEIRPRVEGGFVELWVIAQTKIHEHLTILPLHESIKVNRVKL